MGRSLVGLATLLLLAVCGSVSCDRVLMEPDQVLARHREDWTELGVPQPDDKHRLVFALRQRNLLTLEKMLYAVSTPGSPEYGRFLSAQEVDDLVRPDPSSLRAVQRWLRTADIEPSQSCLTTRGQEFLECDVTVSQASALLQVEFRQYGKNDAIVLRAADHYSVPTNIAGHIDFVGGVHRLPSTQYRVRVGNSSQYRVASAHSGKQLGVVPTNLRELYNVGSEVGAGADDKNMQAVAQFLDQYYHSSDLAHFMEKYAQGFTHMSKVAKEVGPDLGHAGIEASLDIEYIMSLGANIPTWFWSTGGKHEGQEPFLEWMEAVANTSTIPNVISVSYGDDEDTLSAAYMLRISVEFQKVGMRGVSILFASGDDGAGCHKAVFRPNFPASSPYVTSVGGTVEADDREMGVSFSSGGFSNVFARTSYQSADVEKFLSTASKLPDQRFFNKSGRGYPDVSAMAVGFEVVTNLITVPASGTSCAAPTFAGIVSLINDKLINSHAKSPLGFLNPFLYERGYAGLTDITHGCNEGCNGDGFCTNAGWDPVTGLGTPKFDALLAEALKAKGIVDTD